MRSSNWSKRARSSGGGCWPGLGWTIMRVRGLRAGKLFLVGLEGFFIGFVSYWVAVSDRCTWMDKKKSLTGKAKGTSGPLLEGKGVGDGAAAAADFVEVVGGIEIAAKGCEVLQGET